MDAAVPRLLLGALTWAYLALWARRRPPEERLELVLCVLVSGALELLLSQAWGLYSYRLGSVPLYVFAGHGLIWLWASEKGVAGARFLPALALAGATLWAADGVARRGDWHGAFYWPLFAGLMLFSDRRGAYAATFFFTSGLELLGVGLGTWHWSPAVPLLGWTSADPPSVVAGGYCFFALAARFLAGRLGGLRAPLLAR